MTGRRPARPARFETHEHFAHAAYGPLSAAYLLSNRLRDCIDALVVHFLQFLVSA
jgi:hypothetical protein